MNKAESLTNSYPGMSLIQKKMITKLFKPFLADWENQFKKERGRSFDFINYMDELKDNINQSWQGYNNNTTYMIGNDIISPEEIQQYIKPYQEGIVFAFFLKTFEGQLSLIYRYPNRFRLAKSPDYISETDNKYATDKFGEVLDYTLTEWKTGASIEPNVWDQIPSGITADELKDIIKHKIEQVKLYKSGDLYLDAPFDIEHQKFVNNYQSMQTSLFDNENYLPELDNLKKHNIQIRGLDLSHTQLETLHGIYRMIKLIGVEGNYKGATIKDDWVGYEGYIPSWRFTVKSWTENGLRKHPGEKEMIRASKQIRDLATKMCLFSEKIVEPKHNKKRTVFGERFGTLFELEEVYSKENGGKRRTLYFSVRPSAHFYRYMKERNVIKKRFDRPFTEIGTQFRKQAKYFMLFEDYLNMVGQMEGNKGKEIVEFGHNYREMAAKLQMHVAIRARQWSRIRKRLDTIYAKAKELGWIIDYKTDQKGKTTRLDVITFKPLFVKKKKAKKQK